MFQKRERGNSRVHSLANMDKALQIVSDNGVKLVSMSSDCIVDGNVKLTLGLVWSIILHFGAANLKEGEILSRISSMACITRYRFPPNIVHRLGGRPIVSGLISGKMVVYS